MRFVYQVSDQTMVLAAFGDKRIADQYALRLCKAYGYRYIVKRVPLSRIWQVTGGNYGQAN